MRRRLVAAKRQVVDEHVTLLEESGLWSVIVDVDCFALGNGLEFHERLNPSSSVGDKVTALVDVGASKTNVNIMYGLNSCFTRDIYIAGNDFTEAITKKMGLQPSQSESLKRDPGIKAEEIKEVVSSVVDDLCHEVSLSFDYFEHQFDKPIDYIYLSGGGSQLVGLEETLERTFEKKPIRWDPCEMLEISSETVDAVEFKKNAVRLAIATGLAARIQKD
ncbi:MAG: pilus assembly protein PilM [Planctomycetes bacterium]|nr:pilus assembly protein PilM [Planctomycetota bacterium]